MDRASLGAKVLKYEHGTTAIRVSVWGGVTLYTQDAPKACRPPIRTPPHLRPPLEISAAELQTAINDEAATSPMSRTLRSNFRQILPCWHRTGDPRTRFRCLTNAAVGLSASGLQSFARQVLTKRVNSVKVAEGGKPTVRSRADLLVSFVPAKAMKAMPRRLPSSRNRQAVAGSTGISRSNKNRRRYRLRLLFIDPPPSATITQSLRSCARRGHLPLSVLAHAKGEAVMALADGRRAACAARDSRDTTST
jgi:hypothetical protein